MFVDDLCDFAGQVARLVVGRLASGARVAGRNRLRRARYREDPEGTGEKGREKPGRLTAH